LKRGRLKKRDPNKNKEGRKKTRLKRKNRKPKVRKAVQ